MIFALAGNQNCGKTTLFNQLTGSQSACRQFPRRDGRSARMGEIRGHEGLLTVVDLPGIYSLSVPIRSEEIVTTRFYPDMKSRMASSIS